MRPIRLLFENLGSFRRRFYAVFWIGCVDGAVTFFIPASLARFTEQSLSPGAAWRLIGLLALLTGASHLMQFVLRSAGESLGPQYGQYLRLRYFRSIERLPVATLTKYHSGYLLTLMTVVADGLGALTIEILWGVSRGLVNLLLFFTFTAMQSGWLAAFNGLVLIIFIVISGRLAQRMIPAAQALNVERAQLYSLFADFAAQVLTVKRLGVMAFADAKLSSMMELTSGRIRQVQQLHATRWLTLHSLFSLSTLVTIGVLVMGIAHGQVAPSLLVLFVAAFTAVRLNAERLSENYKTIIELDSYARTLDEVLKEVSPDGHGKRQLTGFREISFQDVRFSYSSDTDSLDTPAILVPDFSLRRGEVVGVVGASGEGKTTLLNLLANLLTPQSGVREIDGVPYEEIAPESLMNLITAVSQEAELFHLSLRENLCLGREVADEELVSLLHELGLEEWYSSLELGLETRIGERGVTVSQGQKQRLNLLRGYLLGRDILLLDEPTAHLDRRSEELVCEFLERRHAGRTVVIVTHREQLLRLCGRVFEVKGHRLAAV